MAICVYLHLLLAKLRGIRAQVFVQKVLAGGVAQQSNIAAGDVLAAVNGNNIMHTPFEEIMNLIAANVPTRETLKSGAAGLGLGGLSKVTMQLVRKSASVPDNWMPCQNPELKRQVLRSVRFSIKLKMPTRSRTQDCDLDQDTQKSIFEAEKAVTSRADESSVCVAVAAKVGMVLRHQGTVPHRQLWVSEIIPHSPLELHNNNSAETVLIGDVLVGIGRKNLRTSLPEISQVLIALAGHSVDDRSTSPGMPVQTGAGQRADNPELVVTFVRKRWELVTHSSMKTAMPNKNSPNRPSSRKQRRASLPVSSVQADSSFYKKPPIRLSHEVSGGISIQKSTEPDKLAHKPNDSGTIDKQDGAWQVAQPGNHESSSSPSQARRSSVLNRRRSLSAIDGYLHAQQEQRRNNETQNRVALDDQSGFQVAEELSRFEKQLQQGLFLIKHGRRGYPHARTVFCPNERPAWADTYSNAADRSICWVKPQHINNAEYFRRHQHLPNASPSSSHVHSLALLAKKVNSILLSEIRDIVVGKKTEVFRKSDSSLNEDLCFSLVTKSRTLDLQTSSLEERDRLVRGFTLMLEDFKIEDPVSHIVVGGDFRSSGPSSHQTTGFNFEGTTQVMGVNPLSYLRQQRNQ